LLDIFVAAVEGKLDQVPIEWSDDAAVCVILASPGYPASYPKGLPITGLNSAATADAIVFHAGTAATADGNIVTAGGRVLGVVGLGNSIADARDKAYAEVNNIHFEGKHYRTDIAKKALV
jgi:phosphoribosylamine--glycine ligase